MFDDIEDFDGNGIDFLLAMKDEIEKTSDPDMLSAFEELEEEAIALFPCNQ